MRKFLLVFFLVTLISLSRATANVITDKITTNNQEVVSTEGTEISNSEIMKTGIKNSEDKLTKERVKNRKKFLKNVSKIEKFENIKRIKNRDKEFIESQINLKKQKLEDLGVSSFKKGEDEE